MSKYEYVQLGPDIYERSFSIIRAEADLTGLRQVEERVVVRMIHACGDVELPKHVWFSDDFAEAAESAIARGAPILCDANMIVAGITRSRLRAGNEAKCFLNDPAVPALAERLGTTRSVAAVSLWADRLEGAVVAIGNAPTALFRLLEVMDETGVRPAAIIGLPVGFVGAAESKEALIADRRIPAMAIRGRRGGSAMTVAAINALASEKE